MNQFLGNVASPVSTLSLFLPPSLFQADPLEHMSTYLSRLLRPTGEGAQGGAPSTIQAGASGLCRWCKFLVLRLY